MKLRLPKLWTIERYEDFRAPEGMTGLDGWWLRQFRCLLQMEQAGRSPAELQWRWLVLGRYLDSNARRRLSFDVPDFIVHILDDADVRTKDHRYAEGQWRTAENWLNG